MIFSIQIVTCGRSKVWRLQWLGQLWSFDFNVLQEPVLVVYKGFLETRTQFTWSVYSLATSNHTIVGIPVDTPAQRTIANVNRVLLPMVTSQGDHSVSIRIDELEVSGIPELSVLHRNQGYVTITIDGHAKYHTHHGGAVRGNDSAGRGRHCVWQLSPLPFQFTIKPSSLLRFTYTQRHSMRHDEDRGSAELPLSMMLTNNYTVIPLAGMKGWEDLTLRVQYTTIDAAPSVSLASISRDSNKSPQETQYDYAHSSEADGEVQRMLKQTVTSLAQAMNMVVEQSNTKQRNIGKNARALLTVLSKEPPPLGNSDEGKALVQELHDLVVLLATHPIPTMSKPTIVIHEILSLVLNSALALYPDEEPETTETMFQPVTIFGPSQLQLLDLATRLRAIRLMISCTKDHPVLIIEIIFSCPDGSPSIPAGVLVVKTPSDISPGSQTAKIALSSELLQDKSSVTSVWLAVRPSSRLELKLLPDDTTFPAPSISVPAAEIIASTEENKQYVWRTQWRTQISDGNIAPVMALGMTAVVRLHDFKGLSYHNGKKGDATIGPSIADVDVVIEKFLQQCNGIQGSPSTHIFISSATSVLPRVTEFLAKPREGQSSPHHLPAQGISHAEDRNNTPLRDLMALVSATLTSLMEEQSTLHHLMKDGLLVQILGQLCRITATIEGNIDYYVVHSAKTQTTMMDTLANDDVYSEQQDCLFLSLFSRRFLSANSGLQLPVSCDTESNLGITLSMIKVLLQPSHEDPRASRNSLAPLNTSVSKSGKSLGDRVFAVIRKLLQISTGSKERSRCRRALVKIVQFTDRLPQDIMISDQLTSHHPEESGGYGTVYSAQLGNEQVAVKVVHGIHKHLGDDKMRKAIYLEIVSWLTLKHHRILPLVGVAIWDPICPMCMISPWMTHGTLDKRCNAATKSETRIQYIKEVVEGMIHLHEEGMTHGDLRGANILVDKDDHIKITDFGIAVFSEGTSRNYFSLRAGNKNWIAPEQRIGENADDGNPVSVRPTEHSDVFSFSCLCIELHTGAAPLHVQDVDYGERAVHGRSQKRPRRPKGMSDRFWELIQTCWHDVPAQRPSFCEIEKQLEEGCFA